jgi:hypothetical protein
MEGRQLFALIRVDKAAKQRAGKAGASDTGTDAMASEGESGVLTPIHGEAEPIASHLAVAQVPAIAEGAPA